MAELYIGLMSGTSLDGIDAALVDLETSQPKIIDTCYTKMPKDLYTSILEICQPGPNEINRMGELDVALGLEFAKTTNALLKKAKVTAKDIIAIGSHGQTIRHHPDKKFTLQIGDANVIAAKTGITTVADFRRRDIAHGGQGAPLVPAFHQSIFASKTSNRIILNIGGIANITLLTKNSKNILGFDTGPGNTLLDAWAEQYLGKPYDDKGIWASKGTVHAELLSNLLNDPFFKLAPPKSTGREYFNLDWLRYYMDFEAEPNDVQATILELTAKSAIDAIKQNIPNGEILVCGGGAHNDQLMSRLHSLAQPTYSLTTTSTYGIDPDWVEATAFAWLAKQTLSKKPGNLISVTGAHIPAILGGVYFA